MPENESRPAGATLPDSLPVPPRNERGIAPQTAKKKVVPGQFERNWIYRGRIEGRIFRFCLAIPGQAVVFFRAKIEWWDTYFAMLSLVDDEGRTVFDGARHPMVHKHHIVWMDLEPLQAQPAPTYSRMAGGTE